MKKKGDFKCRKQKKSCVFTGGCHAGGRDDGVPRVCKGSKCGGRDRGNMEQWRRADKTVVDNVVFPAIDMILAVFFSGSWGQHILITANTGSLTGRRPLSYLCVLC